MGPLTITLAMAACLCGDPVAQFWHAPWCEPCKTVAPVIAALRGEGWPIEDRPYDEHRPEAHRRAIRSVPCLIVLDGRREVARCTPVANKQQLRTWLAGYGISPRKAD